MVDKQNKTKKAGKVVGIVVLMAFAFLLGTMVRSPDVIPVASEENGREILKDQDVIWTCSMHPQILLPEPGDCPICGMDLIPVKKETSSKQEGLRELTLSDHAIYLARVQVAPVERKFVKSEIRLAGKIDFDETRLGSITSRFPGRLDKLYVDFTGVQVRAGDPMVQIFSPELLSAQKELIEAQKILESTTLSGFRQTVLSTLDAAREKLRLWGFTSSQISEIIKRKSSSDHMTILSPLSGVVVEKHAIEGMYVTTGMRIYTIADLSRVWLMLDVYEEDLPWISSGQEVVFIVPGCPYGQFKGTVAFVDPVLNPKTQTVRVRVDVPNPGGVLKPGMLVHATVYADEEVCKRYIRQMTGKASEPLVIPVSAPLITGKRAVVYVVSAHKPGVFEGREIELGPRAGQYYIVNAGLIEDEEVVVNGNFKIDSSAQIMGKPSMMSPEGGSAPAHHHGDAQAMTTQALAAQTDTRDTHENTAAGVAYQTPQAFRIQLGEVVKVYFSVQAALAGDDFKAAKKSVEILEQSLEKVDMSLLSHAAHVEWMSELKKLNNGASGLTGAQSIADARAAFDIFSQALINSIVKFGFAHDFIAYRFHCPMAFGNRGADWLQDTQEIRNPYYGASMLKCGDLVETLKSSK
ncbi:MAG: efflux RND transporter periplasmic adaptor subunit [Deltaproteobacteria bacterium]|nr:efflux RND transporter periplasmic adaptor subunit [Deltaproteobacteria bacterium]